MSEGPLLDRCVTVYASIFRRTHKYLAAGELNFVKARDQDSKKDRFLLGLKLGLTLAIVSVCYSLTVPLLLLTTMSLLTSLCPHSSL